MPDASLLVSELGRLFNENTDTQRELVQKMIDLPKKEDKNFKNFRLDFYIKNIGIIPLTIKPLLETLIQKHDYQIELKLIDSLQEYINKISGGGDAEYNEYLLINLKSFRVDINKIVTLEKYKAEFESLGLTPKSYADQIDKRLRDVEFKKRFTERCELASLKMDYTDVTHDIERCISDMLHLLTSNKKITGELLDLINHICSGGKKGVEGNIRVKQSHDAQKKILIEFIEDMRSEGVVVQDISEPYMVTEDKLKADGWVGHASVSESGAVLENFLKKRLSELPDDFLQFKPGAIGALDGCLSSHCTNTFEIWNTKVFGLYNVNVQAGKRTDPTGGGGGNNATKITFTATDLLKTLFADKSSGTPVSPIMYNFEVPPKKEIVLDEVLFLINMVKSSSYGYRGNPPTSSIIKIYNEDTPVNAEYISRLNLKEKSNLIMQICSLKTMLDKRNNLYYKENTRKIDSETTIDKYVPENKILAFLSREIPYMPKIFRSLPGGGGYIVTEYGSSENDLLKKFILYNEWLLKSRAIYDSINATFKFLGEIDNMDSSDSEITALRYAVILAGNEFISKIKAVEKNVVEIKRLLTPSHASQGSPTNKEGLLTALSRVPDVIPTLAEFYANLSDEYALELPLPEIPLVILGEIAYRLDLPPLNYEDTPYEYIKRHNIRLKTSISPSDFVDKLLDRRIINVRFSSDHENIIFSFTTIDDKLVNSFLEDVNFEAEEGTEAKFVSRSLDIRRGIELHYPARIGSLYQIRKLIFAKDWGEEKKNLLSKFNEVILERTIRLSGADPAFIHGMVSKLNKECGIDEPLSVSSASLSAQPRPSSKNATDAARSTSQDTPLGRGQNAKAATMVKDKSSDGAARGSSSAPVQNQSRGRSPSSSPEIKSLKDDTKMDTSLSLSQSSLPSLSQLKKRQKRFANNYPVLFYPIEGRGNGYPAVIQSFDSKKKTYNLVVKGPIGPYNLNNVNERNISDHPQDRVGGSKINKYYNRYTRKSIRRNNNKKKNKNNNKTIKLIHYKTRKARKQIKVLRKSRRRSN